MQLAKFRIKNFRGYKNEKIDFTDFTTFVGINDAGKSTIFEALDIFFKNSRIEKNDRTVNSSGDVELTAYFSDLPRNIKLETVPTTFNEEYLTLKDDNSDKNYLVLKQKYSGEGLKLSEFLVTTFPSDESVQNIHTSKITALKKKFSSLIVDVDKRKSTEIRKVALKNAAEKNGLARTEISLNGKESLKDISKVIHANLPMYQLFKSDRSNTDGDSEIQEPINAIIKAALLRSDIQDKLVGISNDIEESVTSITKKTLNMLREMDSSLSNDLNADFKQPNWSSVFKFNLDTDSGIPLNKRGSGVRRLILLNFFRAEARRKLEQSEIEQNNEINIIYAFEEPETSQHPKFQKMLIDSFKTMSELNHIQVCITTHSPAIAQIVPKDGIRLVKKEAGEADVISGEAAIGEVIEQLGIVPNIKLYPDQLKCVVLVEGSTDVAFFQYIYDEWSCKTDSERSKTVFISGGGTSIVDVLNSKFINQLNLIKKIMIVDGDCAGSDDKQKVDEDNNLKTIQLSKSTIEFYLPYEDVKNALKESEQNPFTRTKDQWIMGNNECKLNKAQKRVLKDKKIYNHFTLENIPTPIKTELKKIVEDIDC
ncbi:ATP-binding protein [Liquorilactobacillus satsumensis]|uniref:ATP-binding protein n=1 Tax=Liquorilactobacillus satsumensis TaxID=259059 RepID=UPI0021C3C2CB|nr:ATP-binding protein [Liquorilactobacillus satsumensis]MCP9356710.1 ATP-binding protein [Liquorilactobacillus satsumensis]MCP9370650.1 ATP-binding protein [Liquorilactobacillus satsumensis]